MVQIQLRWRIPALCLLFALVSGCDYLLSPAERVERAEARMIEGDYRGAYVELKNALQKDAKLHDARLLLAQVTLWLGDVSAANTELSRIPETVGSAKRVELQAQVEIASGKYDAALRYLEEKGQALEPALNFYLHARALRGKQQYDLAAKAFEAAFTTKPGFLAAQIGKIECLAAAGARASARGEIDTLVVQYSESAEAWLMHAKLHADRDAQAALRSLERARDLAPRQLDVAQQIELLSLLLDVQLGVNQLEGARITSASIARLAPGSPVAALASSRLALADGDYTAAATQLRRVVNSLPNFARARFLLGAALTAQGNLEQASIELSMVVRDAPELVEARQLLAQVRMRLDDPDGALRVLVPALDGDKGSELAGVLFDQARKQAGHDAATIDVITKELARQPDNHALSTQLAAAYLQSGQAARALGVLEMHPIEHFDARREAIMLEALSKSRGSEVARQYARSLVESHTTESSAAALGAAFFAREGDVGVARQYLDRALVRDPTSADLLLALAHVEALSQRFAEARAALQELLDHHPAYQSARLALAELDLRAGNKQEAQAHLLRLLEQERTSVRPRVLLARLALANNDVEIARNILEQGLAAGAPAAGLNAGFGQLFLANGRYEEAITYLERALAVDADAAPLWLTLGRAQLALSQYAAARASFEKASELQPGWLAAEGALIFLDLQLADRDAALKRVEALRETRPNDPDVLLLQGQVHASLREFRAAAAAFDAASAIRLTASTAVSSYQARLAGKLPNPLELLERWIDQQPNDSGARSVLADAYTRLGDRQNAIRQYEILLSENSKHALSLNNLAWLYYEQNDARALEIARRARAAAPESSAVNDTLGWILVERGHVADGLAILERAVARGSNNPEITYHYAVALLRSGEAERARAELKQLMENYPTFPSRAAAERLLNGRGNATDAKLPR